MNRNTYGHSTGGGVAGRNPDFVSPLVTCVSMPSFNCPGVRVEFVHKDILVKISPH